MNMMYSAGLMLALMAFLIVVVGLVLVAFRMFATSEVRADHPRHRTARQDEHRAMH